MSDRDHNQEPKPAEALLPSVYADLRKLAAARLARERPGQTLQATALVHEAWLRVSNEGETIPLWQNKAHFLAAAAEAMRRILVETARRKQAVRHGGGLERDDGELAGIAAPLPDDQILQVDEVLDRFAESEPEKAKLVKLRYFAGFTIEQAAEVLGVSERTAKRYWTYSKAWIFREIKKEQALHPEASWKHPNPQNNLPCP